MSEENHLVTEQPETKLEGFGSMLVKVFLEPSVVFHRVRRKPLWVAPFIVLLLVMAAATAMTAPLQFEMAKKGIMESDQMTPEEKERTISQMEQYSQFAYLQAVVAPIFGAIFFFVGVGLLLLMANVILGGDADFARVASVSAWAGMITILGLLVKSVLAVVKGSADVRISLAVLMPDASVTSIGVALLNGLTDIFTIWATIVSIIGIAIVYQFSKSRAAVAVLVPTILMVGIGSVAAVAFG